jgi:addiction module RelE/StbE family toxin
MSRELIWHKCFERAFNRTTKRQKELRERIFNTLELLSEEPFHPKLSAHKLKGTLEGLWACSVGYDCRIIFTLQRDLRAGKEIILLIDIGTHEEVY